MGSTSLMQKNLNEKSSMGRNFSVLSHKRSSLQLDEDETVNYFDKSVDNYKNFMNPRPTLHKKSKSHI
jgi:hypothetical protein